MYFWMGITFLLGISFLSMEGTEFASMVAAGAGPTHSAFLSAFFALIGCHGLHVAAAVAWLLVVLTRAQRHRFAAPVRVPLELCSMYWFYVVGLWAVLFPLVYLL